MAKKLLEGLVLTIDPASGGSSQPGYAITDRGVLLEYGVLKLPKGSLVHYRLYKLLLSLQHLEEKHGKFDILILEKIAVSFGHKKGYSGTAGGLITQGIVHLHWSCGVVLAACAWPTVIQVVPQSWHAWVRQHLGDKQYEKTDANDALVMTMCVYEQITGAFPEGAELSMLTEKGE